MNQYETANLSIREKAKSERLFMNYALALAVLLSLMGSALIVLGIGDHLDIVVSATGAFETRLINASPGVGMLLGGLLIMAWSKPSRLKASASHDNGASIPDDERWDEIEQNLRDFMLPILSRESVKNARHRELVARILVSYLKHGDGRLVKPEAPPSAPFAAARMAGEVNVMFSRRVSPLEEVDRDEEAAIRRLMEELNKPEPAPRAAPKAAAESGDVSVLYQGNPKAEEPKE